MQEQKKSVNIKVGLILLMVGAFILILFLVFDQLFGIGSRGPSTSDNTPVVSCPTDAKLCDDGSYVGREGADCEFALCPTTSTDGDVDSGFLQDAGDMGFGGNLEWHEFTQEDIVFRAPVDIPGLNFVGFDSWPPQVSLIEGMYVCESGSVAAREKTVETKINGRLYCIETWSQGAAGSIYVDYDYWTDIGENRIVKVSFTTRLPQCQNYDGLKSEECTQEEKDFSMDKVVDTIVESVAEPALPF